MGLGTRLANLACVALFGEPATPLNFPNEHWELSMPKRIHGENQEALHLAVADRRYPRLRGTLSITYASGRTSLRWKATAPRA